MPEEARISPNVILGGVVVMPCFLMVAGQSCHIRTLSDQKSLVMSEWCPNKDKITNLL
jgi:hypothetical protein